ncbi:glycosyltransferase family 39 protein [Nostoc sp. FACHB-110]|uniref:glycosyltransferase family 39 protein n=1 Tax=Nostoc sp. FACHB-110 TaxID=2692834 RepID=UPI001683D7DD|nr:glycosyltransferase family 39 protein [Nostoc sp. FACHB-110]MBD2437267.1 glycosyltransferase family 39 protein [Nostoc sp. FACHB-110]
MTNNRISLHYLGLAGAIALGTILRFWHLDLKPLWMDEVITSIFSLGKNYHDLPLDVVFPLKKVQEIFTFNQGVSCSEIATNISTQSTHPPLFFCAMYGWLSWMSPLGTEWVAKLRSLPALFGVATIPAIYWLTRISFSKSTGIIAALIMATSPFAVYLSQEARHYTAPMFFITLSLIGLMQIQRDILERSRISLPIWFLWTIINSIALYIHYFFALALIAEVVTLILVIHQQKIDIFITKKIYLSLLISISTVVISFTPWLIITFNHVQRSETNWLPTPTIISPIYQTVINLVLMLIVLPVENQQLIIAIISVCLMILCLIWLVPIIFTGLKILQKRNKTNLSTKTLLIFTSLVILEFFIITYLFNKDITVVPRYHFIYYPSFCTLLAAIISIKQTFKHQKLVSKIIIISIISCIFVVANLAFQKPFQPDNVAQKMNLEPATPLMLVTGYGSYQDVALGLSFALALKPLRNTDNLVSQSDSLAFIDNKPNLSAFWHQLSQLTIPATPKLNLWIVGPGMRRRDYQPKIKLSGQTVCNIDPTQHYRLGIPYQLYRCSQISTRQEGIGKRKQG